MAFYQMKEQVNRLTTENAHLATKNQELMAQTHHQSSAYDKMA